MRYFVLAILVLALLAGVYWWRQRPLSVDAVLAAPTKYDGQHVKVHGTVGKSFAALLMNYYELCGERACLHVVSNRAIPPEGTEATVEGRFVASYGIGNKRLSVLLEGK